MRSLFLAVPGSIITKIMPRLFCIALIGGCSHNLPRFTGDRLANAIEAEGFVTDTLVFEDFTLRTAWRAGAAPSTVLNVYLEGDGRAWKSRSRLSADPTPRAPVGLRMAEADTQADVLYIARPCQFLPRGAARRCNPAFWSSHRYAKSVVDALNASINQVRRRHSSRHRELKIIGFSGGGALAVLVAAHRDDVAKLVTVAANLNTSAWTDAHGVSPLLGSLNPQSFAARVADIPQRHFVGELDTVVPPQIVSSFFEALPNPKDAQVILVPKYTHECCWQKGWHTLSRGF